LGAAPFLFLARTYAAQTGIFIRVVPMEWTAHTDNLLRDVAKLSISRV
jgi:hypothetical protein